MMMMIQGEGRDLLLPDGGGGEAEPPGRGGPGYSRLHHDPGHGQAGVHKVPHCPQGGGGELIKSVGEEYQVVKRGREYHGCGGGKNVVNSGEKGRRSNIILPLLLKRIPSGEEGQDTDILRKKIMNLKNGVGEEYQVVGNLTHPCGHDGREPQGLLAGERGHPGGLHSPLSGLYTFKTNNNKGGTIFFWGCFTHDRL